MRDDAQISQSEIKFDPADPNSGPILNWETSAENVDKALRVAARIAGFVNAAKREALLDPHIVAADLVCLHCNGRPQDFDAWDRADVVEAMKAYSGIYYNFDRRTGKLPEFVKTPFDKKA